MAFHPAVETWFRESFGAPTPRTVGRAGPPIARGESTLILAPTGSGKTLAAFLACLDRLMFEPRAGSGRRAAACSMSRRSRRSPSTSSGTCARPSPASVDVASARGDAIVVPDVAIRTGDTPVVRARALREGARRHPDHDARVAVPPAGVAGAPCACQRHHGDRRRDSRAGADQARRAPGAVAGTARDADGPHAAAHRTVGHRAARSTKWRSSSAASRRVPRIG